MKEQDLQKKITEHLESLGCYVIKVIAANKNGCPDLLFSYDGRFMACEVKAPGKLSKVTKLQQFHIDLINKTGGKAFAADSLEEVIKQIHSL